MQKKGPGLTQLDRRSLIPLYYQVAQILRDQILAGTFHPGFGIPSERELQEEYSISRYTVRQAIDLLVSEGLVRREQGRGSYVLPEGLNVRSRLDTFFEHKVMLREFGFTTTVQHISTEECRPNQVIKDALALDETDTVICFTKLFLADGEPAILAKDFIPTKTVKSTYDQAGSGDDYFRFLEDLVGHRVEYLLSDILPISASDDIARIFNCDEGTPILLLQELFLDETQQIPIQFSYNYHHPLFVHYSILRKRRQL
jgi:GntR family transcriptional regulator